MIRHRKGGNKRLIIEIYPIRTARAAAVVAVTQKMENNAFVVNVHQNETLSPYQSEKHEDEVPNSQMH